MTVLDVFLDFCLPWESHGASCEDMLLALGFLRQHCTLVAKRYANNGNLSWDLGLLDRGSHPLPPLCPGPRPSRRGLQTSPKAWKLDPYRSGPAWVQTQGLGLVSDVARRAQEAHGSQGCPRMFKGTLGEFKLVTNVRGDWEGIGWGMYPQWPHEDGNRSRMALWGRGNEPSMGPWIMGPEWPQPSQKSNM